MKALFDSKPIQPITMAGEEESCLGNTAALEVACNTVENHALGNKNGSLSNHCNSMKNSRLNKTELGKNFYNLMSYKFMKQILFLFKTFVYHHTSLNLDSFKDGYGSYFRFKDSKNISLRYTLMSILLLLFSTGFVIAADVDLAISQSVSNATPAIGAPVRYTVQLINQGNTTATNVVVRNEVPIGGMTSVSATQTSGSWSYTPLTGIGLWTVPTIAGGDTVTLEINGVATTAGVFFNIAQVQTSPDNDIDSVPGNADLLEDDISTSCFSVPIEWYSGDEYTVQVPAPFSYGTGIVWYRNNQPISVSTTEATVNPDNSLTIRGIGSYTFTTSLTTCSATGCCPIILIQGPIFDLALTKVPNVSTVVAGSQITFTFNVTNQGNVNATAIQLSDYIPVGLTLADANWTQSGGVATLNTPIASLAAGASTTRSITFNVSPTYVGALSNSAEISSARGPVGEVVTDIDSDLDNNPNNNGTSVDDVINQNGKTGGDNDNSDIGNITVTPAPVFDLALRKSSVATSVIAGGQITYTFDVFNQGNVNATAIQISDYVPTGLTLADANWIQAGSVATLVTPIATLAAGDTTTLSITFNVSPTATGAISNGAEISSARGPVGELLTDVDSTPDNNSTNDGTAQDDNISGNGKTGGDEDDHDIGLINVSPVPVFDLALRKTNLTTGPIYPGSTVTFNIDVYNQGTMMATGVKIMDYIPTGLVLADADWTQTGSTATYNNPNLVILAGQMVPLTIDFVVSNTFAGGNIGNAAEISDARGPSGEVVVDIDSNHDANPNNDGVSVDDAITQNGKTGGDEDDSDYSNITVIAPASIGNFVWLDANQNGIQDGGELGISGVNVTLERTNGSVVATTVTDGSGAYLFSNVIPGDYVISFGKPSGYTSSPANSGSNDTVDSDANATTGKTGTYSLVAAQNNNTVDAGYFIQSCADIISISALDSDICSGDSTYLVATSSNGVSINWYLTPSGGTPMFTTNSGQNRLVYPTTTTVYYAQLSTVAPGCPTDRTPVALVVNQRPLNPTCGNMIQVCTGETTNLNTHIINGITSPGGVFEWHTGFLPTSPLVTNPTAAGAGDYYLFERSGAGCYSNPTLVSVTAISCAQTIDLSLLKTADRRTVNQNDNIVYTIQLTNSGPDAATNVIIEDRLPSGLQFVSSSTLTNTSGLLTATIPSIAVGQTVYFTYTTRATGSGSIINVAEVVSADQRDSDSTPGNGATVNEDDDDDEVINVVVPNPLADLSLQKLVSNSTPNVGDNISYTIRVTNAGPNTATNVEIADILPTGLTLVSVTGADVNNATGNTATASFASILSGSFEEFFITATVTGSGSITNRAEVSKSDQQDPDSTPNNGGNEDDDDTNTITVQQPCNPTTPLISCANPYICPGESVSISAIGCNGTVVWSNGMTGNVITVSPTITTTYNARCQVGTCFSPNSNNIQIIVNTIAPPFISASSSSVCAGGSVTLIATGCTGTVTWSNGTLGSSTEVSPSAPVTTYTATCRILTCISAVSNQLSISLTGSPVAPQLTASNANICSGQSTTLTAALCTGIVTWSTGQTGASITVSPLVSTSYTATCSVGSCVSSVSTPLVINVGTSQTPTILASNENTCGGEPVTLTASNCTGGILWSTGATTLSISVTPTATTTYSVTCGTGTCAATAQKTINVGGLGMTPTVSTSANNVCANTPITLTASNCTGTITWSLTSNTAVTLGTGTTLSVSPITSASYTATCATGSSCSGYASIAINVISNSVPPIVTCGSERICAGDSLIFTAHNCTGTVNWSNGATGNVMVVRPTVNTTYSATCTVNSCVSPASVPVLITVITQTPTITASSETVCSGGNVTLTASDCTGTLLWNNGATTVSINVSPTAQTTYSVTCTVEGCVGTASKVINIGTGQAPTLVASDNNVCAGTSVTLTASNCSSTLTWNTGATGNSITVIPANTTTYSASCGPVSCAGFASITVNVSSAQVPVINVSNAFICAGQSTTLTATGCTSGITWSNGATTAAITVSPTTNTTYTATCGSGVCVRSVSQEINVSSQNVPTLVTTNSTICAGQSVTITASNCTSGLLWSTGATTASITVEPTATITYTATCGTGTCAGTANQQIVVSPATTPTLSASSTSTCPGTSVTLTAANCTSGLVWSTGGTTNTITVSPTVTTTYSASCGSGTCAGTASITVTIITKPVVTNQTNVCPSTTVDLTAAVSSTAPSGGSFIFRTGATPESPAVANPTAVATSGTYYVFAVSGNGCYTEGSSINVGIIACEEPVPNCVTSPATASAGANETFCVTDNYIALNGSIGGAATSARWTTSGTGTFENSIAPVTKYFLSSQDIVNGTVTLTLITNDPDNSGPCLPDTSSKVVTINGVSVIPTISTNKSPVICLGDSVILTASISGTNKFMWSTGDTTRSITVTTAGSFSVQYVGANGCRSLSSAATEVSMATPIAAPTVSSPVSNTCPAITVDLTSKVTSTPVTVGGVFEYHVSNNINSQILTTANAVGSGTYYVFEKTLTGCYSISSPITVVIDNCNVVQGDADIQVDISGNKTSVVIGDEVIYTIQVKNNGPAVATNVVIVNELPEGLAIQGGTPGLLTEGSNLKVTIPSLAVGATNTYTYTAKLTKAGIVNNVVKKISSDQNDPVVSNNTDNFAIECTTCQEVCIGTALKADTTRQQNGSYNIKFTALIKNCGNIALSSIELDENLSNMFPSPTQFTVVQKPTPNAGSTLAGNDNYNGKSNISVLDKLNSTLPVGKTDTVVFVINLQPMGTEGPYSTNSIVKAQGTTTIPVPAVQETSDVSNDGSIVVKTLADPTVVRLFKSPSIAIVLSVKDTVKQANGSYNVRFQAIVKNNGSLDLANVIVTDTLSKYFGAPASFTMVGTPEINLTSTLDINNAFNGTSDPRLTLPTSTMVIGKQDTIQFVINLVTGGKKEFQNQAIATGTGTLTNGTTSTVTDISNSGVDPNIPGSTPTQVIFGTQNQGSEITTCVGLALSTINRTKLEDGTYNVTYQAIVKNCGNLNLTNVAICDTLSNTFSSPTEVKVIVKPFTNSGSTLAADTSFNGVSNTCLIKSATSSLASGKTDTLRWTVNIKLNSNNGPFRNNVTVNSTSPSGQVVSDVSNDGIDPAPAGSNPTILNFNDNVPDDLIGLAKNLVGITKVPNKSKMFDVEFSFVMKNYGIVPFTKVQLQDNLAQTFGDKVIIDSVYIKDPSTGLVANTNFTGKGELVNMLADSLSSLPLNTSKTIGMIVRVDMSQADTLKYENIALAIGFYAGGSRSDASTTGLNPDTNLSGDPLDDSDPTVIDFTGLLDLTPLTPLGIAKSVDSLGSADGSYLLTYKVIVKNFGSTKLDSVQLTDDLADVFSNKTQFVLMGAPTLNDSSTLKVNASFDGDSVKTMLVAAQSTLAAGKSDTLTFKVKVINNDAEAQTYLNTVNGTALSDTILVSDKSTTGLIPDKNNDGNPGNDNEPTAITLVPAKEDTSAVSVIIYGGISPNGDGLNDVLVIKDENNKVTLTENDNISVYIYNRWGHLVYSSENYFKDFPQGDDVNNPKGWDGSSNTGVRVEKDKYVPDGTYYYVVSSTNTRLFGGKPYVNFITIKR
ncbi:MAG TPA: SdrD B-like domain-containing protein [Leadbetterella sp.]|nr:SdrD B-like domain-containing protein [Leadbetterella sp.]